jgi:MoCo/4Fe-4S cofactor protein with predicted Tat translocation signal
MSSMSEKYRNNAGNDYWRSLDQLADSPEYRRFLEQEFPEPEDGSDGSITRRKFLGLVGASLAMAGLAGCRKPVEKIVPYVTQPELLRHDHAVWDFSLWPHHRMP